MRCVTASGSRRGCFSVPLQAESHMPNSIKSIVVFGCLGAAIFAMVACSPRRIPPMSVSELMEDRVTLDGVLMKCNQNQSKARTDTECLNARVAIERLAIRGFAPAANPRPILLATQTLAAVGPSSPNGILSPRADAQFPPWSRLSPCP